MIFNKNDDMILSNNNKGCGIMDIKRNTMWLEKGTQILCIGIMLLSIEFL